MSLSFRARNHGRIQPRRLYNSRRYYTGYYLPAKREKPWHVSSLRRVFCAKSASPKLRSAITSSSLSSLLNPSLPARPVRLRSRPGRERQAADPRLFHRFGAQRQPTSSCASTAWRMASFPITSPTCPTCPLVRPSRSTVRTATSCCRSPSPIPSSWRPVRASRPCAALRSGSSRPMVPTAATASRSGSSTARVTKPTCITRTNS
jgi:hypothetical protein